MDEKIEVGDTVTIGTGKVHWSVWQIEDDVIWICSQLSGRNTWQFARNLRIHSKGTATDV